jgi:flagellar basal body-associated protein FliL
MADENESGAEDAKGGGKKLIVALMIVNLLVLLGAGGAVAYVVTSPGQQAQAEAPAAEDAAPQLGPLVELGAFVVNLSDSDGTHYARAGFQLELTSAEVQPQVEERMVPIRSAVMLHLSGLSVADTQGRDNRAALLEDLTELVNEQVGAEHVRRIYFTQFVIR